MAKNRFDKKELQSMTDWQLVNVYCEEMGGIDENDLMIEVKGNTNERESLIYQLLQRNGNTLAKGGKKYAKGGNINGFNYTIGGL